VQKQLERENYARYSGRAAAVQNTAARNLQSLESVLEEVSVLGPAD
jgi:hypothetical protein